MKRNPVSWYSEPVYRPVIRFGLTLFAALRVRWRVRGAQHLPADGAAILAITHFGYLDFAITERILWKQHRRLLRFLATAASFRHPIAGPLMRGMHHIPVEREAGAAAFDPALRALKDGEVIGIFPEASVSTSWTVKTLKTGTVRLALAAGVPIVPVAVWGGHRIVTKRKPSLREAFRVPVHVEIGEPMHLPPDAKPAVETRHLKQRLQELVHQAQEGYPLPASGTAWWLPQEEEQAS